MNFNKYLIANESQLDTIELSEVQRYVLDLANKIAAKVDVEVKDWISYDLRRIAEFNPDMEQLHEMADRIYDQFKSVHYKKAQTVLLVPTKKDNAEIMDSKFGGTPYLESVHAKLDGVMCLQINFDTIPKINELPRKGIFQIWADSDWKNGFTTFFYDEPEESKIDHSAIEEYLISRDNHSDYDEYFFKPVKNGITITPKIVTENLCYHEADDILNKYKFATLEYFVASAIGHGMLQLPYATNYSKLLGMDSPIQDSPRAYLGDTRLLLQLISDNGQGNCFNYSDSGSIQVYIKERDLKSGNFNKVWTYDSCY